MDETPRPWPKLCRFTRIRYAPCTSLEGRTLLPHWIEESFPSPGSCTTQIQRKQGRGRWGREEYRRPCFYLQRGYKGGKRTSKTDYQPEISDRNLMSSALSPSCHIWPHWTKRGSTSAHHTHSCLMWLTVLRTHAWQLARVSSAVLWSNAGMFGFDNSSWESEGLEKVGGRGEGIFRSLNQKRSRFV